MSPNLYDLLDVDESASGDEIRAAWKAAIADLDPTDRRFRAYNDAAGVLLDEDKRTAYDAELAARREAEADEPAETDEPVEDVEDVEDDAQDDSGHDADAGPVTLAADATEPADAVDDEAVSADTDQSAARAGGPGPWSIAAAGVAAVLAVVLAVWVLTQPNVKPAAEQAAHLKADGAAVQEFVGEKVVPATLSYDYRTLDQDLTTAQRYMTPQAAAGEAKNWRVISREAKVQHAVVTATAAMTGLTRISRDGKQAVAVAFVDQKTRKLGVKPFTLQMGVTFVLEKDAKTGEWMVDDFCTELVCKSNDKAGSTPGN